MKKFKFSLSATTFLFFIIFSAVTLSVIAMMQTVLLPRIYEKTKEQNLNDTLTSIITNFKMDQSDLQKTCDDIALYYGTSILITDSDLNTIVASRGITSEDLTRYSVSVLTKLAQAAQESGGSYQEKLHIVVPKKPDDIFKNDSRSPSPLKEDELESLIQVSIISSDVGSNWYIYISSVLSASNEMYLTNRTILFTTSVVMLVLSLILALVFSRSISRPIVEMNDEATKLMDSNFNVAFEENTHVREIDELGEKLNLAASELGKVDRLRSELVANISHDLRTPLTLIAGYSEMMRDIPGEANEENLNLVISESKRLSSLVNDVLDLSKYSSDSEVMEKDVFDLTDLIRSTIARIEPFIRKDGFIFTFEPQNHVTVSGNKSSIERVIYNLLQNAVNYSGSSRHIEIYQKPENNEVRIEITDHGLGISKEELPYVFDRYYRSSKNHERALIGSGLGLSIVKSILEQHGAGFGVQSSPGAGSTFWFTLSIAHIV